MDGILATALITACGGMTIIAYRHFDRYKPFSNAVTLVIIALLASLVAYQQGLRDAGHLSPPAIAHRTELILHAKIAVFLFVLYGTLLEYLPKLLKLTKDRREGEE